MRRMYQLNGIRTKAPPPAKLGEELADVRVRVDFAALARALGPKAIKARTMRVELCEGAVTVEAFNIRKAGKEN